MRIIKVSELQVGMRFSKPLLLDRDNIFINALVPISENDIARLSKFGFAEVMTLGEIVTEEPKETQVFAGGTNEDPATAALRNSFHILQKNKDEFVRLYKDSFDAVQTLYRKVAEDKVIELNQIRSIAEQITDHVRANPNFSFMLLNYSLDGYYLYNQVVKATFYSLLIAMSMDYSRPKMVDLAMAGLLSDVGMSKIPGYISEKTATLNEEEYKVVKKHPLFGYQILTKNYKVKNSIALVALQHHENFDGTGYPQKMKKNEIEEASCIYSIADTFSALVSNRPWRRKFQPYEALKTMISVVMNRFDLNLLRMFLNKIAMYPVGS
ncbi:MAG TPA: HD domain-containing phosphohydrolase, partial [Leptospiraceae bacterium]|nr:HD domain-containing phosphohydrolase [Leptospiraceae bacterium]